MNLSEKINELLGGNSDLTAGNLPSQLLNEDGLPIIDISEPVDEDPQTNTSPFPLPEQDSPSLFSLPPDERERRRRERDRILELLEEEERLQQVQEERDTEEERKEAIRRRKESAKAELDQLRAARELQKKMGQALVWHAKGTGNEENARSRSQIPSSGTKKSVSFADAHSMEADERGQSQPGWGDVTPGRLRSVPLVSTAEAQKSPLKKNVVERRPMAIPVSPPLTNADSDDESSSSAELPSLPDHDSSDEEVRSSSSDSDLLDEEPLDEGFDYDTAQHHREIALEYHRKRHTIAAETEKVMAACTLDDCEKHETFQSNGQSPLSRFRADHMTKAYGKSHGAVSLSTGTIIPASGHKSLRNSVRLGKLENDQLVGGGSGESGSEDETIRELVQMLRTGSIQNVGPDIMPSSMPAIVSPKHCDDATVRTTSVDAAQSSEFELATFQGSTTPSSRPALSNVVERKTRHFPINRSFPRRPVNVSESPSSNGSPSSCTMKVPPSLIGSSAPRASIIPSPADASSVQRPISKFMAERREYD